MTGDLLDRTGAQIRSGKRGDKAVHKLLSTRDDDFGRQYRTACHRYLYADEGAVLTTQPVDCSACSVHTSETEVADG